MTAGLWRGLEAPAGAANGELGASGSGPLTPSLHQLGGKRHPGSARRVSSSLSEASAAEAVASVGSGAIGSVDGSSRSASAALHQQQQQEGGSGRSVLIMGVTGDGRVWQWQLPLLWGTLQAGDGKATAPEAAPPLPRPDLLGALRWACCVCPCMPLC